jgi:hypothetical protein
MRSSKEELTIMRFISTAAHGLADYSVGFIVVGFPFYYGLTGASRATFVALGLFVIVYSLLTDYELGLVRVLRIRFHLLLDALFGLAMLAAPTVLRLPDDGRIPVYVIGVLSLLLSLTTKIRAQGTRSDAAI